MKFLKNKNKGKNKNNKISGFKPTPKTKIVNKQKSSDTRVEQKPDGTVVKTTTKTMTYKKVPISPDEIKKDTRVKYFMIFLAIMLKIISGASSVYQLNQLYEKIKQDVPDKEEGENLVSRMKKIATTIITKHKSDTVSLVSLVFALKELIIKAYLTIKYGKRLNKNQAKVLAEQAAIETSMNIVFGFMNKMLERTMENQKSTETRSMVVYRGL